METISADKPKEHLLLVLGLGHVLGRKDVGVAQTQVARPVDKEADILLGRRRAGRGLVVVANVIDVARADDLCIERHQPVLWGEGEG